MFSFGFGHLVETGQLRSPAIWGEALQASRFRRHKLQLVTDVGQEKPGRYAVDNWSAASQLCLLHFHKGKQGSFSEITELYTLEYVMAIVASNELKA